MQLRRRRSQRPASRVATTGRAGGRRRRPRRGPRKARRAEGPSRVATTGPEIPLRRGERRRAEPVLSGTSRVATTGPESMGSTPGSRRAGGGGHALDLTEKKVHKGFSCFTKSSLKEEKERASRVATTGPSEAARLQRASRVATTGPESREEEREVPRGELLRWRGARDRHMELPVYEEKLLNIC